MVGGGDDDDDDYDNDDNFSEGRPSRGRLSSSTIFLTHMVLHYQISAKETSALREWIGQGRKNEVFLRNDSGLCLQGEIWVLEVFFLAGDLGLDWAFIVTLSLLTALQRQVWLG